MAGGLPELLGIISRASYNPKLNAVGVNEQGQPVDANGNVTTLYAQPGWFQKGFNPAAQDVQQMNLQMSRAPIEAEQAQNIKNLLVGQNYAKVAPFGPANVQGINPTVGGLLTEGRTTPEALGQEGQFIAQNQMGQPMTTAMANTIGQQNLLSGQRSSQALGNPFAEQLNEAGKLAYDTGLNTAHIKALPEEAQTILNQAAVNAGMTGQLKTDLPINTGTQRLGDIIANYQAGYMPDMSANTPYLSYVTPEGVSDSGGVLNRNFRPPSLATMQALVGGNALGNTLGNSISVPTPQGNTYNMPAQRPGITHPTVGTQFQPQMLQQTEEQKRAEDAQNAQHDSLQADIKAKKALLDSEAKAAKAKHLTLPVYGKLHNAASALGNASLLNTPQNVSSLIHEIQAGRILGPKGQEFINWLKQP